MARNLDWCSEGGWWWRKSQIPYRIGRGSGIIDSFFLDVIIRTSKLGKTSCYPSTSICTNGKSSTIGIFELGCYLATINDGNVTLISINGFLIISNAFSGLLKQNDGCLINVAINGGSNDATTSGDATTNGDSTSNGCSRNYSLII